MDPTLLQKRIALEALVYSQVENEMKNTIRSSIENQIKNGVKSKAVPVSGNPNTSFNNNTVERLPNTPADKNLNFNFWTFVAAVIGLAMFNKLIFGDDSPLSTDPASNSYDKLDYALNTLGGRIASLESKSTVKLLGIPIITMNNLDPAKVIITAEPIYPGKCWKFSGKSNVIIKLAQPINVNAIQIEHLNQQFDKGQTSSAPNNFEIWGYENDFQSKNERELLGNFTYSISKRAQPCQKFNIKSKNPNHQTSYVELNVLNNHGKPHTCVYRFRVYGNEVVPKSGDGIVNGVTY